MQIVVYMYYYVADRLSEGLVTMEPHTALLLEYKMEIK